ncbi:ABC transporter ATP-binding protein/permease [uncultured Mobiluncus sp.]|uniref:ABC transporter ATP-binding protein/permease n=1 Tax=uncultured Mobiluncus sp. TaxID=293425 RepID=UPI0026083CE3|nr:ATP-binding cassette domain-containing protein [uncultured Mobiluncus sp.]
MPNCEILKLGRAGWIPMCATSLFGLLHSAVTLCLAWIMSRIFATLYSGNYSHLFALLEILAVLLLVRPVIALGKELLVSLIGMTVKIDVRLKLLQHLNGIGPFGLSSKRTGEAEALVTDGVELLEDYYGRYVPQIVVTVVTAITVLILLFQLDSLVALIGVIVVVLTPTLPKAWNKVLTRRGYRHWEQYSQMNAEVVDAMQGMTTLQLFNGVEERRKKIVSTSQQLLSATLSQMRISLLESAISSWVVYGGPVMVLTLGVRQASQGNVAVASLFWCMFLGVELFRPFQDLSVNWHAGYHGYSTAQKALKLLKTPTPDDSNLPQEHRPRTTEIQFNEVSYRYSSAQRDAVSDISLEIPEGEALGLVGQSGCGKSTMLGLLLRFGNPSSGNIQIGGVDLRALSRDDRCSLITLVPQEPVIFDGTIADNLRACAPKASDERLHSLCLSLGLEDIAPIDNLLDFRVDERGSGVSGGQRQRLAIARALLRETPILLLDEATSALDAETERLTWRAIDNHRKILASKGRSLTVISSAHRLESVRAADRIVVLSAGKIVEIGNHDSLMQQGGTYAMLVATSEELVQS